MTDGVFKKFDQEVDKLLNGGNARTKLLGRKSLTKDDKKYVKKPQKQSSSLTPAMTYDEILQPIILEV